MRALISQDTNTTQYELMKALSFERCVSVVGDPDQSSQSLQPVYGMGVDKRTVYGWRSADVKNLGRMCEGMSY